MICLNGGAILSRFGVAVRLHNTTLGLSAPTILALAGCSNGSTCTNSPTASAPVRPEGKDASAPRPLFSAALSKRLLDESGLGEGYIRRPEQPKRHDAVTVTGCPALEARRQGRGRWQPRLPTQGEGVLHLHGRQRLRGGRGAVQRHRAEALRRRGPDLRGDDFVPHVPGATRQYPRHYYDPEGACRGPAGRGAVESAAHLLAGGRSSVVKQTAVRVGRVVAVVSGSSALVDAHVERAVAKARGAH